jgi:hypothetical protein
MAVHGRASNGALPFCFGAVAARPVRSYYLVTPEHRNRHPVAKPTHTCDRPPSHHLLLRFHFFNCHMFCASEKTPGHQKAARRGGEKDEGIFQRIGLPGTWTWPAEYPFTGRTLATEPYGKMTPRLPDGHQIFPNI